MRFVARILQLSSALLLSAPCVAHAYDYCDHSKIVQRAVEVMQARSAPTPLDPPAPSGVDPVLFAQYLAEVKDAPAKLSALSTGLPKKLQGAGVNPIAPVGLGDEAYPFTVTQFKQEDPMNPGQYITVQIIPPCKFHEDDDLSDLSGFSIAEFRYFPLRTPSDGCGLEKIEDNDAVRLAQVLGQVLGWHAGSIDDHFNDSVMWFKPTNTAIFSTGNELAITGSNIAIGALIAAPYCIVKLARGESCSVDEIYAFANRYNPVVQALGLIPGNGDWRDELFTGLWHFINVDREGEGDYNNLPGMYYLDAGTAQGALGGPGAFDAAIIAMADASGLTLNAIVSDGPYTYAKFDEELRFPPAPWMPYSIAHVEFSPLDNLARYGWEKKYLASGGNSVEGLAWPLHAIGDACAPHHVIGTSSWGHVPYEDAVKDKFETFYATTDPGKTDQMTRILLGGFSWWSMLQASNDDVDAFIRNLAKETRQRVRLQGDWAYIDGATIEDLAGFNSDAQAHFLPAHFDKIQDLLELSTAAAVAFLARAGTAASSTPSAGEHKCPVSGDVYTIVNGCVAGPPPGQPLNRCPPAGPCDTVADCPTNTVYTCVDQCCLFVVD